MLSATKLFEFGIGTEYVGGFGRESEAKSLKSFGFVLDQISH
jgi:hypothetical protein